MLLEFKNLNLPDFVEGSGQPLTAAWLCFKLKFACQAPIAANAAVSSRFRVYNLVSRLCSNTEIDIC